MTSAAASMQMTPTSKPFIIGLWAAQIFLFAAFCCFGFLKVTVPIADLARTMKWTVDVPASLVRMIGVIDMMGGIGILLPAATRIMPKLTVLAALGCSVLQILAIFFHASRGEFSVLPLNFVLLPLSVLVLWGRGRRAPIPTL